MEINPVGIFLALCLLPAATAAGTAFDLTDEPPPAHSPHPRFLADADTYLGAHGPAIDLAFQMAYPQLFFRPDGGHYRTDLYLVLALFRGREQVGGDLWTESREVASRSDARIPSAFVRRVEPIECGAGKFSAEVTVREADAGREERERWEVEVPDYDNLPLSISSLWLVEATDADTLQVPPKRRLLQRRFGEPLPPVGVVGEVYRPTGDSSSVRLTWRIRSARSDEIRRGDLTLGPGRRLPFRIRPELSTLWLGTYTFEVEAVAGADQARRRFTFDMDETSAALEGDPAQSLALISLIATPEETLELKETIPAERKEAWNRFWKRHDPTPDTPENEFKDEFFTRVRYAEEHFSVLGPGWKTDRGRTYIRYGPPDQVESYPDNQGTPPYEVWIYERLGRRFVFVDYEGFGRYELYQPGRF